MNNRWSTDNKTKTCFAAAYKTENSYPKGLLFDNLDVLKGQLYILKGGVLRKISRTESNVIAHWRMPVLITQFAEIRIGIEK